MEFLKEFIFGLMPTQLAISILFFIAFLVLRRIFTKYVFKIILRLTSKTRTDLDKNLLLAFEKPLQVFFIVFGLYIALFYYLSVLDVLSPSQSILISKALRSTLIILVAWGFYNFTECCSGIFFKIEKQINVNFNELLLPFLSKTLRFLIIFIAGVLVASEWNFDINGFIAGLGLGGLAVALAAKDAVANVFGGIVIILEGTYSVGDWIQTNEVEGTVEDITFRSTKVRTFAHALVSVPNASLANQAVTNWTKMGKRRITFNLGVTYSTPKEKLEKCVNEIREMLKNHSDIHPDTIFVTFNTFNESSLDIFLYFFTNTTNWGEFLKVKEDINFKIMEIIENEEVEVAFPSRSIYFETQNKTEFNL